MMKFKGIELKYFLMGMLFLFICGILLFNWEAFVSTFFAIKFPLFLYPIITYLIARAILKRNITPLTFLYLFIFNMLALLGSLLLAIAAFSAGLTGVEVIVYGLYFIAYPFHFILLLPKTDSMGNLICVIIGLATIANILVVWAQGTKTLTASKALIKSLIINVISYAIFFMLFMLIFMIHYAYVYSAKTQTVTEQKIVEIVEE